MKIEVYRAESGVLHWRDDSFWQLDITFDHETTGTDAAAFAATVRGRSKGMRLPLLIYRAPLSLPSFEALNQFAQVAPELLSAVAYWVVSSRAARTAELVRAVFLKGLPVEVFTEEAAAVAWITEQLAHQACVREV